MERRTSIRRLPKSSRRNYSPVCTSVVQRHSQMLQPLAKDGWTSPYYRLRHHDHRLAVRGLAAPLFLFFSFSSISFNEILSCTYMGALPSGTRLSLFPHLVKETVLRRIHRPRVPLHRSGLGLAPLFRPSISHRSLNLFVHLSGWI
jgi:hypothetical protein